MDFVEPERIKDKQSAQLKKIGQYLIEQKLITPEQLETALARQTENYQFLGQIFVDEGWVSEEQVLVGLATQYKMPYVRLQEAKIEKSVTEIIPLKAALHYRVMPVKIEGSRLVVAIANPQDIRLLDGLSLTLNHRYSISPVLSTTVEIEKAVARYYGLGAETVGQILGKKDKNELAAEESSQEVVQDIQKGQGEASVVRLVNQILLEAHERRATDIHFEPYRGKFRIRYRVDGVLETVETPDDMRRLFRQLFRVSKFCQASI